MGGDWWLSQQLSAVINLAPSCYSGATHVVSTSMVRNSAGWLVQHGKFSIWGKEEWRKKKSQQATVSVNFHLGSGSCCFLQNKFCISIRTLSVLGSVFFLHRATEVSETLSFSIGKLLPTWLCSCDSRCCNEYVHLWTTVVFAWHPRTDHKGGTIKMCSTTACRLDEQGHR